jgi:plasmid maintenance system antidote protein VapI
VTEILNGRRAITGDTAPCLAHFFGTSAEFWLNLQLRDHRSATGHHVLNIPALNEPACQNA